MSICWITVPDVTKVVAQTVQSGIPFEAVMKNYDLYDMGEDMFLADVNFSKSGEDYTATLWFKDLGVNISYSGLNNACCEAVWEEELRDTMLRTVTLTPTTVTAGVAAFTKATSLKDYAQLHYPTGSAVGETIIISYVATVGADLERFEVVGTVTWDNATTLTVAFPASFVATSIPAWASVVRGARTWVIGNCSLAAIGGKMTPYLTKRKTSKATRIPFSLDIQICDLTLDRDKYRDAGYTMEKWYKENVIDLATKPVVHSLMQKVWYDNEADGLSMGMYGSLVNAQQVCGVPNLLTDWRNCCATQEPCEVLRGFRQEIIEPMLETGLFNKSGEIIAWCNNKQIASFNSAAGSDAIRAEFGEQVVYTASVDGNANWLIFNKRNFQSFQIGSVKFVYKYSPIVELNYPSSQGEAMYLFPSDQIGVRQFGGYKGTPSGIEKVWGSEPTLQVFDSTDQIAKLTWAMDCQKYVGSFTYHLIIKYIESGAYRFVSGLNLSGSCGNATVCSRPANVFLPTPTQCV